jgi:predicted nucleic acid-binding protein
MKFIGADGRRAEHPSDAAYAIARSAPEERWIAPDGAGRIRYGRDSAPFLPSPEDERAWRAAGSPDLETLMPAFGQPVAKRRSYGMRGMDAQLLANANLDFLPKRDPLSVVPRTPRELRTFLYAAAERQPRGPVPDTVTAEVLRLLNYPRAPAQLRAALLEAVSAFPGARELGEIEDAAGRKVQALRYPGEGDARVLAYDRVSARLLAVGAVAGRRVLWQQTLALSEGAVGRIGERP